MTTVRGETVQAAAELDRLHSRLRVEQRKLEAVRELSRALGATLDLDRLLVLLLNKVTELLDAERATLYLVSDGGDELVSKIVQGGAVQEIRLLMGEGIAGSVALSGQTLNIADAYSDERFQMEIDQRTGFRTRSILCMPMPNHMGKIIGVMQLLNKRDRPFDSDDESLLGAVAAHSGIAIENSKLYLSVLAKNAALVDVQEQLRRKVDDLDLLVEIQREASAAVRLDELLDRLLKRAMQLVESEAGAVLLKERSSGDLYFRAAVGGSSEIKRFRLPLGHGIAGWVALHGTALVVNDPSHDARHDSFLAERLHFPPHNILAVPLTSIGDDGEVESIGAIEVLNRVGRRGFDDADMKLLTLISGHASRAIQFARAKEERINEGRLAAIGQMLSGMMHDLKSPMTIVSGYVQLMAQTEEPATREKYTELILRQLDHMGAMTREVLSFAKGESNLLVRKVYLHKFMAEVTEHLEREFIGKNVKLEVDTRFTGVAWFDELKLLRVIHNIARNAGPAMPDGGTFRIVVDSDPQARTLKLDFSDTGQGIPADLEGRLFQLFATSGKRDGTGLGLAIVKKIVDEHGGQVTYTSAPGEGTTFHVVLPIKRE
ncbi:MAG: GAF domain-containing sensor histidine kinase [Myxococcales bacterium]|nr:GAF domain-containing sensor histidine kinase [Myxococcales bacterium]